MGIPDSSLLDLIEKVRSWFSWSASNHSCFSQEFMMPDNRSKMCCMCDAMFNKYSHRFHCESCGRWMCRNCIRKNELKESDVVKTDVECSTERVNSCKFCNEESVRLESGRKFGEKVHPLLSPRESPEPPSHSHGSERIDCSANTESIQNDRLASYLEARDCGYSPPAVNERSMTGSAHPSPVSVCRSHSRGGEEEAEDSGKHFCSPLSEYSHDTSDIEIISISDRHEFYSFKSVGSSPSDSPSRNNITSYRVASFVQQGQGGGPFPQNDGPFAQESMAVLEKPERGTEDPENSDYCSDDLSLIRNQYEKFQKLLDFENDGHIWYPPPPEDANDEVESNFFSYDDEDDEIGDSGAIFSSSSSLSNMFSIKQKQNEGTKEPLKAVVQGHFRALVSQLLQGERITVGEEESVDNWLDIVTTIAWQAANFVKPDTSKGGSMDPGDYVKVKCIASGCPSESTLIKGVVCTKNVKHKRMTSQYKNPRLLLLGGALEFQKVPNQLASFNTLLQQENDHLKPIMSKIEALRPNVLLVEKSVSTYAQEYLLEKDISLVLNMKRPVLDRIARCTGALVSPSINNISSTRLGHCELFRLEKVSDHETSNQFNKKTSKTLMFFEGCPRRLGCTVLLRGTCREELKKVKHVLQFAVFAAYHLSLETSFLADEGASLPKMALKHSISMPEKTMADNAISVIPSSLAPTNCQSVADASTQGDKSAGLNPESGGSDFPYEHLDPSCIDFRFGNMFFDAYNDDLASKMGLDSISSKESTVPPLDITDVSLLEFQETLAQEDRQLDEIREFTKSEKVFEDEVSSEYFSAADTHQSILVSFSSRCVLKGTVCERSRLLRIKFYGCFDKPLGRYLRDDLFDQTSCCRSCGEPAESHVLCYTHQQGNLTINVRCLPSVKLPGELDGKIWMWHRCLRCAHTDGVPPATRRVVMSDAAWGLSFGKFLELSFSNNATANRVATCGHSLQRDCLRYYGFGSMVAFFRYSPIDILSVHLPPLVLEFNGYVHLELIKKEAAELMGKMENLYAEISDVLDCTEEKSKSSGYDFPDSSELHNHIMELKDQLKKERSDYNGLLQPVLMETSQPLGTAVDILELNRLRRALLISSHVWNYQLHSLDTLLKKGSIAKATTVDAFNAQLKELRSDLIFKHGKLDDGHDKNVFESLHSEESSGDALQSEQRRSSLSPVEPFVAEDLILTSCHDGREEEIHSDGEITVDSSSDVSALSERIDSAWTGTDQLPVKHKPVHLSQGDGLKAISVRHINKGDNPPFKTLIAPVRVHSFDSALRFQERIRKGLPPSSLHLSTARSFHASGDYRSMVRDPVSNVMKTCSHILSMEAQKLNLILTSTPTYITSASHIAEGARLLLPQKDHSDVVIAVYDNDPASIISYALCTKEYEDWVADKPNDHVGGWSANESNREDSSASTFSAWQSFGSLDLDYIHYGSYGSEDASSSMGTLFTDNKKSSHLTISFGDKSATAGGKVRFSITFYFAKHFDSLRKKCCPSEMDFVRSLSRCQTWSAQGGKSNAYFAKSLDDRFIIKQVTKTELEAFEEFAPEYFKYLTDSLTSGSPTCLAKVLGIFQVSVKNLKGGKETKIDLMVMENLFFRRRVSRIYDLKGSVRSRYNTDTTGKDKVLLDMNLLEILRTEPIFLGSKAKRSLERAIWNDTAFLASVDVMDYSLLVGVDEERKELVLGIIDYMRQYTWDKHLETWVKASGILGGPKNASPTIISPKQYKKRFRKAMTTYFLTVPDQWTS
ncbi:Cpn60_TCP1 domain-containing protein/PIP5K domain-containing protein [Cephalotus follicularis]|uniref:1-phosphatidylinositol-3-phosphate 5-kinase n=1 Tax=Cephalotus follicularis TaxID=3775 RepID=A0A1Q3CQY7_CEPFO|nr:Cpn60_TCP1 domain-containing protein/PIP5K domain-containing protein [Cephalotus follicularis]GAV82575.1 Cpn60_TCP1 domain-containing protein/PIP5K domain-containing protein [Cephalotus follicularis]